MKWISVESNLKIPWTKVLVYDGGNTSFGYLQSINISQKARAHNWIVTPDYEGTNKFNPTHWAIIETPKDNE